MNIQPHGRHRAGTARRWAGLTATLASAALLLAACSSGGADDATTGTAGGSSDPVQDEAVTLTVWHYFSADNQVALMDAFKDKFEASHSNVTVENVFVPYDQLNSKTIAAAGAGTGPDVVVFNGAEMSTLALGGALLPLDEYWASYADTAQFPDSVLHELDGSLYAVQGYVNLLGLWYNADILAELGIEPPTTVDELEAAMATGLAAGYDGITMCGVPQGQGEWQAFPWVSSEGFSYDNLDAGALAAGFNRVASWVDAGYLSPEVVTWDQTVPFQEFLAGNTLFAENGNWQMGTAAADATFEYGVVPLPLSSTGMVYLGGEGEGIGAFSENPDVAWQYLSETYFDVEGQLLPADIVGSIPSRLDSAQADVVTSNALLKPFAATIAAFGANYPSATIPPDSVPEVQLTIGQAWSAVLGGQQSGEDAASAAVATVANLLK